MSMQQNKYYTYIKKIISGEINHGIHIKKLCESIENDLNNDECKFYFDETEADRYIKFIENLSLTEAEWAGIKCNLELWQAFIIAMAFGWKNKETNIRRYDEVTIHIPKKNGKTAMAAFIAIAYSFLEKNDYAGQIYMAATNREQANICFKAVKRTINLTKGLNQFYRVMQYAIINNKNETNIKALSGDAPSVEGFGSSLVIFDEYHLQKTDELKENLITGQAARKGAMFISISTAGTDKTAPYFQHVQNCKNIVNGFSDVDSHLAVIYESDSNDWRNKETWIQCNPNYGVSVLPEKLDKEFKNALEQPSKQPSFITKHLNIWADSASTWIDSKLWNGQKSDIKLTDLAEFDAYLGLDLGSTGDFSALSVLIPKDDKFYLFMKFWIPEDMAGKRTKSDGLKFKDWANKGYIKLTDGNATDYNVIKNDIAELSQIINIKSLSYDVKFASMLITQIQADHNIECHPFSQAITNVTGATKQFYEWVANKALFHDGNPVMAWMIGNVLVQTNDANGNLQIHKGKSKNKVDGPTATINAVGDYMIDYANSYGDGDIIVC